MQSNTILFDVTNYHTKSYNTIYPNMSQYNITQCNTVPEIQRVSVAQVVLQLKVLGVKSPMDFPYISPPSIAALKKALEMLYLLGALNPVCFTATASSSSSSSSSHSFSMRNFMFLSTFIFLFMFPSIFFSIFASSFSSIHILLSFFSMLPSLS